jgi:hypothetical protein
VVVVAPKELSQVLQYLCLTRTVNSTFPTGRSVTLACSGRPVIILCSQWRLAPPSQSRRRSHRFVRPTGWRSVTLHFPLRAGSTAAQEPDHANARLVDQIGTSTARSYPWRPRANARSWLGTNALALDPMLAAATAVLPTRCRPWQRVQFGRPVNKCRCTCGFFSLDGYRRPSRSSRRSKIAHFRQSLGKVQP